MKIVFSKNHLPLSVLIRWLFECDCSHFSMVFDEKLVIHSNLLGVKLAWWGTFQNHNEIVHHIDIDMDIGKEEILYRSIIDKFDGASYDFTAFVYFGFRGLMHKFLGFKMPKVNPWNSKTKFLCTEVIECLPDWVIEKKGLTPEIQTPHQIFERLKIGT